MFKSLLEWGHNFRIFHRGGLPRKVPINIGPSPKRLTDLDVCRRREAVTPLADRVERLDGHAHEVGARLAVNEYRKHPYASSPVGRWRNASFLLIAVR